MLLPQDVKRAVDVGRRLIAFDNEQIKQLKMFGEASLRYGVLRVLLPIFIQMVHSCLPIIEYINNDLLEILVQWTVM